MMTNQSIKRVLKAHNLSIMQLCQQIGIDRTTYYKYSYRHFKGYEDKINAAIQTLVNKNDKGDANHAN